MKAQVEMVKLAMTFIDKIEDEDVKMGFIQAMKDVCEKKIYLEVSFNLYLQYFRFFSLQELIDPSSNLQKS